MILIKFSDKNQLHNKEQKDKKYKDEDAYVILFN